MTEWAFFSKFDNSKDLLNEKQLAQNVAQYLFAMN